ncbi:MAG: N-acetyltransferase [Mesorhizobium sp.]|nr:MAG: N-acetyltransferase [Mesorhizobium sp.]
MNVIWGSSKEPDLNVALGEWCRVKIGLPRPFVNFTSLGVFDHQGELLGAAVFHNWDPEAGVIEVSGASTSARWLPRPVLYELFSYVFNQLGCQALVMRVAPENTRIQRILRAYGYEENRIKRLRGRHEDELIFILYDDVWRSNGFHRQNKEQMPDG